MNSNEFTRVQMLLKSNFPKITIFDSPDSVDLVYNALNRYDFRDTWKGVLECVQTAQFAPTIREITDCIERAEKNRHEDEKQQAAQTWTEAVRCPKCNDAGFVFILYRKPTKDPAHCFPDDHPKYPGPYDYTEVTVPCTCSTAKEKFPWAFMDELEWAKWIDDERRKGRNPPSKKPGQTKEYYDRECGEVFNVKPGRRPQIFTRTR